jgi:hypothetical protein
MALAYEAIFGKPVSELFDGTYAPIRAEVARRAKLLLTKPLQGTSRRRAELLRKGSIETIATRS